MKLARLARPFCSSCSIRPEFSEFDAKTLEERPYDIEKAKRVFLDANERLPVS